MTLCILFLSQGILWGLFAKVIKCFFRCTEHYTGQWRGIAVNIGVASHRKWATGQGRDVPTFIVIGLSGLVCPPLLSVMGFWGQRALLLHGCLNKSLFCWGFFDGHLISLSSNRFGLLEL